MVSLVHAARDIARVRDISRVLVRHGFGEIVNRVGFGKGKSDPPLDEAAKAEAKNVSPAVRIRLVLEDLGPSFVKLGQIISTRADLLPDELIAELKKLQDSVPPVPVADIKAEIEQSLGAPLEEFFEDFCEAPLAAASVAQVHRAKLKTSDGLEDVVVKVQRPGIQRTIAGDLDLLHSFAALLEHAVPETRIYSPTGLVQQFDRAITSELDFTSEAENAGRFAQNFQGFDSARFPKVYRQASSKRVITLEYLDGKKIYDAIAHGHNGQRLARLAMQIVIKQIFEDGFFHADPHPGNVLVLGTPEKPVYALVDLGMVGRLSPRMRDLTVDLMIAALRKDYDGIADAMYAIGTPTTKIDMNAYRAEVAILADRYLGKQLKDIELSALVRDLVGSASRFGIEVPPDFLLVGKTLMTIEGVGKEIDPEMDIFEEAKPFFFDLLRQRYSPERLGNDLLRRIERLSGATSQLPDQLREILDDLRLGRLTVRTADPSSTQASERLGRRVFTGLAASTFVLSGTAMVAIDHPRLGGVLIALGVSWIATHSAFEAYRAWRHR